MQDILSNNSIQIKTGTSNARMDNIRAPAVFDGKVYEGVFLFIVNIAAVADDDLPAVVVGSPVHSVFYSRTEMSEQNGSQEKGRTLVLTFFFKTWCPFSKRSLLELTRGRKYAEAQASTPAQRLTFVV